MRATAYKTLLFLSQEGWERRVYLFGGWLENEKIIWEVSQHRWPKSVTTSL